MHTSVLTQQSLTDVKQPFTRMMKGLQWAHDLHLFEFINQNEQTALLVTRLVLGHKLYRGDLQSLNAAVARSFSHAANVSWSDWLTDVRLRVSRAQTNTKTP